jgi:hypothetical protein
MLALDSGHTIGNVCHPELLGCVWHDLLRAFQQVGMAAKVVMAVRSLMIGPLTRNQLSVSSQEIK